MAYYLDPETGNLSRSVEATRLSVAFGGETLNWSERDEEVVIPFPKIGMTVVAVSEGHGETESQRTLTPETEGSNPSAPSILGYLYRRCDKFITNFAEGQKFIKLPIRLKTGVVEIKLYAADLKTVQIAFYNTSDGDRMRLWEHVAVIKKGKSIRCDNNHSLLFPYKEFAGSLTHGVLDACPLCDLEGLN